MMRIITCPYCKFNSPDTEVWACYFCPSYPDKCSGCELDEGRRKCPECDEEFLTEDGFRDIVKNPKGE